MGVILLFLYIFNFNIIKGVPFSESSFIVLGILLIKCIMDDQCNNSVFQFLNQKQNKHVLALFFICIILSTVIPLIQFTFDFSYLKTLIHQLIILITGYLLVGYFQWKKLNIIDSTIKCFFLQSIIQFACFISPTFLKLTDMFRSDELIAIRNRSYRGFRGLAISGSGFFGLAVSYAVLFVLLAFYLDKWKKPISIKMIAVVFLIFGAISAGRTALIGVLIFAVVYLYRSAKQFNKNTVRNIGLVLALATFFVLLLKGPVIRYLNNSQSWTYMRYYLLQFAENDSTGQGANLNNITSLSHMFNDMYFTLSPKQVLFGDGMFTGVDGKYYMHTDVGIMRNLLFYGIFGTIALYYYHYRLIFINADNQKKIALARLLFLLTAIMEIKGQTMGFLMISQSLLLVICSNYEKIYQEEDEIARS